MPATRDSYDIFLKEFGITKQKFFNFGLENTIFMPDNLIEEYWGNLKDRVLTNQRVVIRGYGRDAKGTPVYIQFHEYVFNNTSIVKDGSNNSAPQSIVKKMTELERKKDLLNYQVSHIFGMTRNALLFEAPWNIALVPKIIDPLTGHESNGNWAKEYQKQYFDIIFKKYSKYIEEYNQIIEDFKCQDKIEEFVYEEVPKITIDEINKKYLSENKKMKLIENLQADFKFIKREMF